MAISDFADLMPATVTVGAFVNRDRYGAPNVGTPTSYSARVLIKDHFVKGQNGETVLAKAEVWLQTTDDISVEDVLTMPDGSTPPIMAVDQVPDESGAHHVKVHLG